MSFHGAIALLLHSKIPDCMNQFGVQGKLLDRTKFRSFLDSMISLAFLFSEILICWNSSNGGVLIGFGPGFEVLSDSKHSFHYYMQKKKIIMRCVWSIFARRGRIIDVPPVDRKLNEMYLPSTVNSMSLRAPAHVTLMELESEGVT